MLISQGLTFPVRGPPPKVCPRGQGCQGQALRPQAALLEVVWPGKFGPPTSGLTRRGGHWLQRHCSGAAEGLAKQNKPPCLQHCSFFQDIQESSILPIIPPQRLSTSLDDTHNKSLPSFVGDSVLTEKPSPVSLKQPEYSNLNFPKRQLGQWVSGASTGRSWWRSLIFGSLRCDLFYLATHCVWHQMVNELVKISFQLFIKLMH